MDILSYSNGPALETLNFEKESTNKFVEKASKARRKKIKQDSIFNEFDRITFDVSNFKCDEEAIINDIGYKIINHDLKKHGYLITDYIKGVCKKENDKREYKIGRVLSKFGLTEELKLFDNSKIRQGFKKRLVATLSKNRVDILTMSTNKGWVSCMNIINGGYKKYTLSDIRHHTFIVYLHEESDKDIKNPSERILIKKFIGYHPVTKKEVVFFYPENKTYGTSNYKLKEIAIEISKLLNADIDHDCLFLNNHKVYNDGRGGIFFHNNEIKDIDYYFPSKDEKKFLSNFDNSLRYIESHVRFINHYFNKETVDLFINSGNTNRIFILIMHGDRTFTVEEFDNLKDIAKNYASTVYQILVSKTVGELKLEPDDIGNQTLKLMRMNTSKNTGEVLTIDDVNLLRRSHGNMIINPECDLFQNLISFILDSNNDSNIRHVIGNMIFFNKSDIKYFDALTDDIKIKIITMSPSYWWRNNSVYKNEIDRLKSIMNEEQLELFESE